MRLAILVILTFVGLTQVKPYIMLKQYGVTVTLEDWLKLYSLGS